MLLVRACGAYAFLPWTLLERAGVQRQTVLATLRIIYSYEEMRDWSSIYSSQWFACLASHTSRSNSPVTHPSCSFPFQVRLTSRSDCYRTGALRIKYKQDKCIRPLGRNSVDCNATYAPTEKLPQEKCLKLGGCL
ncbi:hypothetical protein YC2023_004689 [Brassica napus]